MTQLHRPMMQHKAKLGAKGLSGFGRLKPRE
jgi:hypothetical protein